MDHDPIVITGLGICSAIGNSVEELIAGFRAAKNGFKPYRCEQAPNLVARFAATDDDFDPSSKLSAQCIERWDRGTQLAAYAAMEAIASSRIDFNTIQPHRVGLATGASGSGQFHPSSTNPFLAPQVDPSASAIITLHNTPSFQTNELARFFGFRGPLITVSSASAGSGIAIGAALRWLQTGRADFVLAGGGEGLLPLNIIGFDLLGLLSPEPCSPFSRSQGMAMGEGAGFVTLERLSCARNRGANILGELYGFAVTSDAFDAIQFDPSGNGIARAISQALHDAQIEARHIDWIKSSGAGGSSQDAAELAALTETFSERKPLVSSLEPMLGHCNGAGPAMGLVSSIASMNTGIVPATLNFDENTAQKEFDFVPNRPREQKISSFVATTAAFGGTNVVMVGGRLRERTVPTNINSKIAITGLGLITPHGCGSRTIVPRLLDETLASSSLDRFGPVSTTVTRACLVRDFEPRKILPVLRLRGVDLLTQYAAAATKLALDDSALAYPG